MKKQTLISLCLLLLAALACGEGTTEAPPSAAPPSAALSTATEAAPAPTAAPTATFEPLPGRYGLFVMALDGSGLRQVWGSDQRMVGPRLSPDGTTFLFSQITQDVDGDGQLGDSDMEAFEIGLIGVDGSDYRLLTDDAFIDAIPAWSPDGAEILFTSNRGGSKLDLFVMDLEGNVVRQLTDTPDAHEADPDWQGETIVYTYNADDEDVQSLWVMDAGGGSARQVTYPPAGESEIAFEIGDYDPRLSPDGAWIAWERHVDDSFLLQGEVVGRWDILRVRVDGSEEQDLTNAVEAAGFPHWSPDGSQLLFYAYTDDGGPAVGLFVMDADGANRRPIDVPVPTLMVLGGDWFPTEEGLEVYFTAEVLAP